MKRVTLGILAAALTAGVAFAQTGAPKQQTILRDAQGKVMADHTNDPHRAYAGNTYTCYWPGQWECHHWWNPDGTEQFFEVDLMPEGMIVMIASDGPHDSFIANGQWCSHNAKTGTAGQGARTLAIREENVGDKPPDLSITNNNKNGCQPVVDATPGDHWFKFHPSGRDPNQREQYTLEPGHH